MNYQRIYDEFIADRRIKELTISGYTEKHHIIPRSHGGSNAKGNLIKLSAQDHYFAHELLAKIHGGGMWSALFLMSNGKSNSAKFAKTNRSMYEKSKIEFAKESSRRMIGKGNHFYGKTHTAEARKKIIENRIQVTGKDHHEYNPIAILWGNIDGRVFNGTQNELRHKYGFNHKPISEVFHGKRKSYKGWFSFEFNTIESVLDKGFCGLSHHMADHNIYLFIHSDGRSFKGKRQDFYKNIDGVTEHGTRAICNKKNKTHRGWSVEKLDV